jgi:6-phosphogluconate dehydrogenase
MKLGMIGLGRMGGNMVERLSRDGHELATYARSGGGTASSLEELVGQLDPPRVVWLMIPAGAPVDDTLQQLYGLLEPGDIVVEGGNSYFRDSIRRADQAREHGIRYIDAGVSGGIWGLTEGYCLMVGCDDEEAISIVEPAFLALAPEAGYEHVGPSGAGHFVKMVHNGVEYGIMQAYAEGFELLNKVGDFDLDLAKVAALWNHGSVVRSWLLELLEVALAEDPNLDEVRGYVEDSGEGRWTVQTAVEAAVPAPTITLALFARFASRQDESFAAKVSAALRKQFGGHAVKTRLG